MGPYHSYVISVWWVFFFLIPKLLSLSLDLSSNLFSIPGWFPYIVCNPYHFSILSSGYDYMADMDLNVWERQLTLITLTRTRGWDFILKNECFIQLYSLSLPLCLSLSPSLSIYIYIHTHISSPYMLHHQTLPERILLIVNIGFTK